jgi:hypothetical protein
MMIFHDFHDRQVHYRLVCILIALLTVSITLGGCEPLRKKFVRQKKKSDQEEKFIPVLEPIEYESAQVTPEGQYQHRYGLWMIWQKEMLTALEDQRGKKKLEYVLGEILTQLIEMEKLVTAEKAVELKKHRDAYQSILNEISSSAIVPNELTLSRNINNIGRQIRDEFTFNVVKDNIAFRKE